MKTLPRRLLSGLLSVGVLVSVLLTGVVAQTPAPYQLVAPDSLRSLPVHRTSGTTDLVTLDVLARLFDLAVREDARTGGVVVSARRGSCRSIFCARCRPCSNAPSTSAGRRA
jgi:hypothetical protein